MKNFSIILVFLFLLAGCSAPDETYSMGTGGSGGSGSGAIQQTGGSDATGGVIVGGSGGQVVTGGSATGGGNTGGSGSDPGTGGSDDCDVTGFSSSQTGVEQPIPESGWPNATLIPGAITVSAHEIDTNEWTVILRLDATGAKGAHSTCWLDRVATLTVQDGTITLRESPYAWSGNCSAWPLEVEESWANYLESLEPVCEVL